MVNDFNRLNWEQLRVSVVGILSPIMAFYTPIKGFMIAMIAMFAFNIFCGMRADGVVIQRCKNFSMDKFRKALWELVLYLIIILLIYTCLTACGDKDMSLLIVKSITYVFMYVYTQNAFRNLIVAYPEEKAFHIIYHIIRLELTRAMPGRVSEIIERYNREHKE